MYQKLGELLVSASSAAKLTREVIQAWEDGEVVLDCVSVRQMTPTFSNILILNLIHAYGKEAVNNNLKLINASEYVLDRVKYSMARSDTAELTHYEKF